MVYLANQIIINLFREKDEVTKEEEKLVNQYIKKHFKGTTFSSSQAGKDALGKAS